MSWRLREGRERDKEREKELFEAARCAAYDATCKCSFVASSRKPSHLPVDGGHLAVQPALLHVHLLQRLLLLVLLLVLSCLQHPGLDVTLELGRGLMIVLVVAAAARVLGSRHEVFGSLAEDVPDLLYAGRMLTLMGGRDTSKKPEQGKSNVVASHVYMTIIGGTES